MQSQLELGTQTSAEQDARNVVARLLAERAQSRTVRVPLPSWARLAMRIMPRLLITVTAINLAVGLVAVTAPLLRVVFGDAATNWIYDAYSLICPQRPSHTSSLAGEPMAMEQRMISMYIAFGLVGLLYRWWPLLRRPLPNLLALLGIAPAVVDVALSSAGIRTSTVDSRLLTGALASLAIVWWFYPRFEAMLRRTRSKVNPAVN